MISIIYCLGYTIWKACPVKMKEKKTEKTNAVNTFTLVCTIFNISKYLSLRNLSSGSLRGAGAHLFFYFIFYCT